MNKVYLVKTAVKIHHQMSQTAQDQITHLSHLINLFSKIDPMTQFGI